MGKIWASAPEESELSCAHNRTPRDAGVLLRLLFYLKLKTDNLKRFYSPNTVTNSLTDAADFCSAAFSSAVNLI